MTGLPTKHETLNICCAASTSSTLDPDITYSASMFQHDGICLFTERWSGKQPHRKVLLLCESLGGANFLTTCLQPLLTPRYDVISWHYRGHGCSPIPAHASLYSMAQAQDDLAAVVAYHRVKEPILLGYSLGSHVCFDFANQHKDIPCKIISVCGQFGGAVGALDGALGRIFIRPMLHLLTFWAQLAKAWKPTPAMLQNHVPLLEDRNEIVGVPPLLVKIIRFFAYRTVVSKPRDAVIARRQNVFFLDAAATCPVIYLGLLYGLMESQRLAELGRINGDVLLLVAQNDILSPPDVIIRAHKTLCSEYTRLGIVDLLELPSCSHFAPSEKPETIAEHVITWLDKVYE